MANLLYRQSSTPTVPVSTSVKNSPLTNLEVDANFKSVNNDLATKATTTYVDNSVSGVVGDALALAIALG